jgi:exosortase
MSSATPVRTLSIPRLSLAILLSLSAVILWSYWTTLAEMASRWSGDPQYSHGYLVPLFAGYLLWMRRRKLKKEWRPSVWGVALLAGATMLRLVGTRYHLSYFDPISLLPAMMGVLVLAGGRAAFSWSWPAVAYLAFMVPLPHTVSLALSGPMQSLATTASTFLLQVLGRPALAEGNVILLNEIELGIVEACSGLRMLVVFFALSTAVASLSPKPLWEKLLLALSAVPIALVSNILRIVATGLFYDTFGNHFGGTFFHDLAGWLMMPLGLAFLGLEMMILRRLLLPEDQKKLVPSQLTTAALYRG